MRSKVGMTVEDLITVSTTRNTVGSYEDAQDRDDSWNPRSWSYDEHDKYLDQTWQPSITWAETQHTISLPARLNRTQSQELCAKRLSSIPLLSWRQQ